jgi:two-component system, LytTR family, sensor kinase
LMFKIENSLCGEKVKTNGFGNGLGLDNLRKRLEIMYPDKFELKLLKDEDSHLAVLKLNLSENTEGPITEKKIKKISLEAEEMSEI